MKKIGFIDYYLDEWHSCNYPKWIRERSGGRYEVAYAYGEVPSPRPGGRTNEVWSKDMGIPLCGSIEEVIDKSDVLIVLAPDNPEQHPRLCRLACESGKRLYIDKTFADDAQTAREIFRIADEASTPCYSTSALRFAEPYLKCERNGIKYINSFGGGEFKMYSIHQIEPIVSLMGTDAKRVMFLGDLDFPSVLIEFSGGRKAQFNLLAGEGFSMKVGYNDKKVNRFTIGNEFWDTFTDNLIEFFDTGIVPVPHEETVAVIGIRAASIKALTKPFEWVDIEI
jgi:hypothetical protein